MFADDWFVSTMDQRNLDNVNFSELRARYAEPAAPSDIGFPDKLALQLSQPDVPVQYFDVGANYGQSAIRINRLFSFSKKLVDIYSFEPGQAGRLTPINLAINNVDNAVVFPMAVGAKRDVLPLFYKLGHTEDNKIINKSNESLVRPVVAWPLDELVPELAQNASIFLKIDTQGAEVEVFRGSAGLLAQKPLAGVFEFAVKAISSRQKPAEFVMQQLKHLCLFELDPHQQLCTEVTSEAQANELVARVWERSMPFCDLLFLSRDHPLLPWVRKQPQQTPT